MRRGSVCIFGGAFDPIHIGHLIVAEDVRVRMNFEKVYFVPCNVPPTKDTAEASPRDRMEMVKLAIKGNSGFEASDIEIRKEGRSYTVDTLREVSKTLGKNKTIYLLMGTDQSNAIESWHRPEEIVKMSTIIAMRRPGFTGKKTPEEFARKVSVIHVRQVDVSSTEIRKRLHLGLSIRYLVTEPVLDYIYSRGLYTQATEHR